MDPHRLDARRKTGTSHASFAMLLAAGLLAACGADRPAASTDRVTAAIDSVRAATATYHDLSAAAADGYIAITPCWYHGPNGGAMGYHYGRPDLIEDVAVELLRPEALMYEPKPDGTMEFVGVEYIVPIAAWQGPQPPSLLGREFFRDEGLGLFTLHIWHVRENPQGAFSSWNPNVTCAHAAESEDRGAGS